jgi:hypothetical protein
MTVTAATQPTRLAIYIAVVILAILLPREPFLITHPLPSDFTAFWCAGKAILAHQNPYLDASLHACDLSVGEPAGLTTPVPYPPYVMALFAALALIPVGTSVWVWYAVLIVATGFTAMALTRLTGLHLAFTTSATTALLLLPSLWLGQVALIAVCSLAWALVLIRDDRPFSATGGLAGAAILPSFAVAPWVAAFVCVKSVRVPLAIVGLLLVAAGFFVTSPGAGWSYLTGVLPSHAGAESTGIFQVGLSVIVRALGASEGSVQFIADALFVAFVAFGVIAGIRLRERYGGDHWIVASAAAFGVVGGPFVHPLDLGFILPFALMLYASRPTGLSALAIVLLVTPWQHMIDLQNTQTGVALAFLIMLVDSLTRGRFLATALIIASIGGYCLTVRPPQLGNRLLAAENTLSTLPAPPPTALAEFRWREFNQLLGPDPSRWYERAPVYAGFVLLALATVRYGCARVRHSPREA